jgi:hypothetical protein
MYFVLNSEEARKAAIAHIAALPLHPTRVIEISPYRRLRTLAQNRLYRLWNGYLAEFVGYMPEEMHNLLRETFLGYREISPLKIISPEHLYGIGRPAVCYSLVSTTELNTLEMSQYLNKISTLAYHLDVEIPYPQDADFALNTKR